MEFIRLIRSENFDIPDSQVAIRPSEITAIAPTEVIRVSFRLQVKEDATKFACFVFASFTVESIFTG